jgi:hypothetical protein
MVKSRFLLLITVGLLISNLLLVGYVLSGRKADRLENKGRPAHPGPRNLIIDKLHFTDEQVVAYDKLISWHRKEVEEADEQIIQLKNKLYEGLNQPEKTIEADSIAVRIADIHKHLEQVHYKHFQDIGNLCIGTQKADFESLTKEIASLFAHPPHKPR